MSIRPGTGDDRQVIPRWRSFADTISTGELRSLKSADAKAIPVRLEALRRSFASEPNLYAAADLLNALIAERDFGDEANALTDYISANNHSLGPLGALIAGRAQQTNDFSHLRNHDDQIAQSEDQRLASQVRVARMRLRKHPRNALVWVDLSLAHATLGDNDKAAREIEVALALAPDSRFVLRSASRLFVHLGEADRANQVLNSSGRLAVDPWIMAAELSTAQLAHGRHSHVREAREMLASQRHLPRALSELASELATAEVQAGRDKRARILFSQAFIDPTENAVAQAAALATKSDFRIDPALLEVERGYEARAINHAGLGEWTSATIEATRWQKDQPFAVEPILYATYTAALGNEDYAAAVAISSAGLRTHVANPVLNNNAAFAYANLGDVDAARRHFAMIDLRLPSDEKYVYLATSGLIAFREGKVMEGRDQYEQAVSGFRKENQEELASVALALWAMEELRSRTKIATRITSLAEAALKKQRSALSSTLQARLSNKREASPSPN